MVVAVIHNPERTERKIHFDKQCYVQKIWDVIWFPAVFSGTVEQSISLAHKQCIRYAKERGLKEILILEDDVQFVDFGAFEYFLQSKPDDYDIFTGGLSGGLINEETKVITSNFSGFFCYMVHERFYDTFLSADESQHIDCWVSNKCVEIGQSKGHRPVFKCCYPFAAITTNGYSDNLKTVMDYSGYFKMYKLWVNGKSIENLELK